MICLFFSTVFCVRSTRHNVKYNKKKTVVYDMSHTQKCCQSNRSLSHFLIVRCRNKAVFFCFPCVDVHDADIVVQLVPTIH